MPNPVSRRGTSQAVRRAQPCVDSARLTPRAHASSSGEAKWRWRRERLIARRYGKCVVSLIAVALGTHLAGCKPVVLVGALCACATVCITLTASSRAVLAVSQVTAAASFATHQAFTGMLFQTLSPEHYRAAAHGIKAATLAANCASALVGQLLRGGGGGKDGGAMPLETLFVVSLVAQLVSLIPAALLSKGAPRENAETVTRGEEDDDDGGGRSSARVGGHWTQAGSKGREKVKGWAAALEGPAALLTPPAVWMWCLWSLFNSPVHSFVATNWQVLVKEGTEGIGSSGSGQSRNGYLLAVQYAAAGALTMLVGSVAYRKTGFDGVKVRRLGGGTRGGGGEKSWMLWATSAVCGGLLLGLAAWSGGHGGGGGGKDPTGAYVMLIGFNCVYEAATCVCAANIGTHARAAAAGVRARRVRRGGQRPEASFSSLGLGGSEGEGGGRDGVRAGAHRTGGDERERDVRGDIVERWALAEEHNLGSDAGNAPGVSNIRTAVHVLPSVSPRTSPPDSFGSDITFLFVALSAAGYAVETAMQSIMQVSTREMSLPARFGVHGALLFLVAGALATAQCALVRCWGRGRDAGDGV